MARNLPAADMSIKQGKWDRKFTGVEICGKTLGVIGCGRIGQVVASTAQTMGMTVLGYDPVMGAEAFKELGIQRADLDHVLAKSDFLTVHTPLTPETSNLLNDEAFAKCKKGVRVINCARGGIVDEAALLRALESGRVGGAALDVFTSEPPKAHLQPLLQHPKLICTPHLGASTDEAQVNVARDIAQQMCDVFAQRDYLGVVNVDYLAPATQVHMQPFMQLAETLGAMHAQLSEAKVVEVTLRTCGGRDVNITAPAARRLLQAEVLKGLVKYSGLGMVPDLISAPAMAKELGVQAVISAQAPQHPGPYWNLLSVEALREDGSKAKITGAVFGNQPHIVEVDDYSDLFAFKPEGNYILAFQNEDRPGVISEVLDVLHGAKVNIASMNVARAIRKREDGKMLAWCFMALDDDVTTHAMKALKSLSSLHHVAKIQLR
jgi:D-3-phosphoglycerate dehydrogenase